MEEEKKEQEGQATTIPVKGMIIECPNCKQKIEVNFDIDIDLIKGGLLNALGKKESGE